MCAMNQTGGGAGGDGRLLATVVVPMRNEEEAIARCIRAIADQDIALECVEVLLVDGQSKDRTVEIAQAALEAADFGSARVLTNDAPGTPSNLNRGLAAAAGPVICRVDARSFVPRHYVRACMEVLDHRADVVVVGGSQHAVPPDETTMGRGIARSLNNRLTMGLAKYRRGAPSGPADTVYLGAFRTDQLRLAGGWNDEFATNQDFELNRRMAETGIVWFESSLVVDYLPRSELVDLWRQYVRFGSWKLRYWTLTHDRPRSRQLVLLGLPLLLVVGAVTVVGLSGNRRRTTGLVMGTAALGAVVADAIGSDEGARPAERMAAVAATCTTSAGWLLGVYGGVATLLSRWTFRRFRRAA